MDQTGLTTSSLNDQTFIFQELANKNMLLTQMTIAIINKLHTNDECVLT